MNGNEFLRKLKKLGERNGVKVELIQERGKGSHGTVYYGRKFTVLKDRKKEIGKGLLNAMCKQLEIDPHEL
ncbi:MAG: type II toxin-antitoxin system HicA family toxin [Planctomycetes bacterium]|nr:type II toxin-antitoxin system HicA family toxin [Planctomycetota bacterium]